jgi:hypothetical protein
MINKEVQRYTIYIPSGLHKNLKIYAATKSVPISKIIIDLITSLLKENK